MYVLKILDSYGYFALSEVFTTLLTSEFGVSDVRAGAYYGAWGTAIVLYGVLTGFLVDYLGVRTSLVCSYALQTLSRLVIAFTRDRASLFATVFLLHPLASAWGAPVMTIAIKRLTSATDRTVSFGIFYAMMNVAALLSGVAIDALRLGLPHGLVGRDGDPNDAMASPVRVVVASTIVTSLVAAFVAARFRELPPPRDLHRPDADVPSSSTSSLRSLAAASAGLWRERRFRQFLAMALFTLNLKQIFRHMDATFPKYAVRAFGCSAPFGTIYAINPALIIVGVPVVASATADRRHFDARWITAAAPFIVAASQTYAGAVAFVVVTPRRDVVVAAVVRLHHGDAPAGKGRFRRHGAGARRRKVTPGILAGASRSDTVRSAGTGRGSRGVGGERRRGGRRARGRRPIDVGDHRRGDDDVAAAHRRVPSVAQRLG